MKKFCLPCTVFSRIRLFRLLVTILLVLTCVGANADTFTKVQKIDVTWPFCAGTTRGIFTDFIVTNDTDYYPTGPVYEKNNITLVTSGSSCTNISSGLTVVGTKDISSYTSKLTSWSDNDSTTFTTFVASSTGEQTIDLVISPNYPGYKIIEDSVTFMAFKKNYDGNSNAITITPGVKWGSGSESTPTTLTLAELPTEEDALAKNQYKSYETFIGSGNWYGQDQYFVGVGALYRLRLYIDGLQEGDTIYIGNVCVSFDVKVDEGYSAPESYEYTTAFTSVTSTGSVTDSEIGKKSIVHKAAKWYQDNIRKQSEFDFNDDFDEDNSMVANENGDLLQATHVYVDTIYMKKGSSINLLVPGIQPNGSNDANGCSINNYFRWFNYRNDKNFYCDDNTVGSDERKDLLIPVEISDYTTTAYRFGNGYVSGLLQKRTENGNGINGSDATSKENTLRKVSFYYPTDDEYETLEILDNFKYNNTGDNSYYAVACDLSIYNDFSNDTYVAYGGGIDFGLTDDANSEDGSPQIYCEPTLTQRVLFYIIGIDDDMDEASDLPTDFQYYGNLFENEDYQGGTNTGDEKYLEEYEITFPSKRISNYTDELVALSKDAQAYALPFDNDPTTSNLDIVFADDDNTNNFSLTTSTISGANRVIQFYKETSKSQWSVTNNSTATILVTKDVWGVTYNIARFKLTFKDFAIPLTEPQVALLDSINMDSIKGDDKNKYWWKDMTYRSKSYMNENYDLVNSLWFDYGSYADTYNSHKIFNKASNNAQWPGQYQNYPFPLKWSNSSYGFYDGSYDVTPEEVIVNPAGKGFLFEGDNYRLQTWYCMYNIVSDYVGWGELNNHINPVAPQYSSVKKSGGSWLYVDASDRPGTLAELEFKENLCQGSEVIATAWIKSAGTSENEPFISDDAAVMFTIMGVTKNNDGTETHTPIYRQYSGQIRTTTYVDALSEESSLLPGETGKGSGTNEWFQLYMSFVNSEDVDYDYYTVRIDNCCASTNGGDYYLDEISVYVVQPTVNVAQIEPVCTSDETTKGYAPIRLDIDYESIMACFGLDTDDYNGEGVEEITDVSSVDFMIINKYKYDNYIKSGSTVAEAIQNSIVTLYYKVEKSDGEGLDTISTKYPTLSFYRQYKNNDDYEDETAGENYPSDGMLYKRTDSDTNAELLAADFYSDISAYTPYMIVLRLPDEDDESDEDKAEDFADLLDGSYNCAVKSEFYVTSTTKIRVNGEIADPSETLCMNQVVHIEPQGTYTTTEEINGETVTVTHTIDGECFDWFVGTEDEYVAENEDYENESLKEALSSYRLVYPTESSLASDYSTYKDDPNNVNISAEEGDDEHQFTENEYNMLTYYIEIERLALFRQYLEVHVPETGLTLVIQPIEITDYELEGDYANTMICFGYVPLVLMIDGQSPTLNMGFSDVSYPSDFTPALRLGMCQLKKATKVASASTSTDSDDEEYTPITVNLRDASYVVEETEEENGDEGEDDEELEGEEPEEEEEQQVVDHLGRIDEIAEGDSIDYAKLYLVGTNDSDYVKIIEADNFGTYELEVGEIKRLFAHEDSSVSDTIPGAPTDSDNKGIGSYMQVYFYDHIGDSINGDKFVPKEGCYYSMAVHFEEKDSLGNTIPSPCYGSFPLVLKVVPEYLVWQGTEGSENWNDDNNWRRADRSELNKTSETDEYLTNKANKTDGGYVPMLFTKVVLPKDSRAELYMAGFDKTAPDTVYTWKKEDDKPTNIYPIEDDIMYDMMVYNESRETGTEGKKDTLLTTKRYRVNLCDEIHLEPGAQLLHAEQLMYNKAWIDVSIPTSQWTLISLPLKDIYAGDWYTKQSGKETSEYFTDLTFDGDTANRSNPLVYQRSWDSNATIVEVIENSENSETTMNSYSSTGWSSVYNNGAVPYAAGSGFSVKAYQISNPDNDGSVLFRFPKSDSDYTTTSVELDKDDYGQLWVSDFVKRTVDNPDDDGDEKIYVTDNDTIRVSYSATSEGYCLVGNPFTAYLSTDKFLEVNDSCISAYWLGTEDGPVTGEEDKNSEGTVNDYLVPPYGAFYAVVKSDTLEYVKTHGVELKFTKDMQKLDNDTVTTTAYNAMSIRAVNSNGRSSAAFAYSDNATDDYSVNEDAVLLEDASWKKTGMPLVYTVAGSKAVSVNSLKELRVIPLGVFADDGSTYSLTFVGVNNVEEPVLYDAELNTETPINEGFTMTLTGATHGRYFIRTNGKASTDIQEVTEQKPAVTVYSPTSRTIIVSSDDEIKSVEVYSINGSLLKRATVNGSACTITDINCDIAIVKVYTESGSHVSKIRVKK